MTTSAPELDGLVARSIDSAVDRLFELQRGGSWRDTLPSAALATASAIVALHFADPIGSAELISAGAAWLRRSQSPDGGWGNAVGAPSTLNATSIAVAALHLVSAGESGENVARGRARIEAMGGLAAVADRRRCKLKVICEHYLAIAGLLDENRATDIPLKVALLPRRLRQKVSFIVPGVLSWALMLAHAGRAGPLRTIDRCAERRALAYLSGFEEFEGSEGGFEESPFMVGIVSVGLSRAGVGAEIVDRCCEYLRQTVRPDGSWSVNRDLEFSATAFVTLGMQDSGYASDPRMQSTVRFVRSCQRDAPFAPTGCPGGGWGWSMPSGWPNTDDTADALIALAGFGVDRTDAAVAKGLEWLRATQNRNGSWSCFCRNVNIQMDAACSVMTAHAVTALRLAGGSTAADPAVARAVAWFAKIQRPDGAIPCLWYEGLTAGTGCVLDALGGLGLAGSTTGRGCQDWLLSRQLPSGAWGDGEQAAPSVENTAWALLGLLGAGLAHHRAVERGAKWLVDQQRPDGLWDPALLGVYFLDLLYSCDHLANGYALQALGRYRAAELHAGTQR